MFWRVFFHCNPTLASDLGGALEDHVSAVSWFETKDSKQGWEGDYKGGEYYLQDDVYTYFLKVKWFHEEQYVEKDGTIMMFR